LADALSTVQSTIWAFSSESRPASCGARAGRDDRLARILEPYIIAFNSLPRIALVPLITMTFGFVCSQDRARLTISSSSLLQHLPGARSVEPT